MKEKMKEHEIGIQETEDYHPFSYQDALDDIMMISTTNTHVGTQIQMQSDVSESYSMNKKHRTDDS